MLLIIDINYNMLSIIDISYNTSRCYLLISVNIAHIINYRYQLQHLSIIIDIICNTFY